MPSRTQEQRLEQIERGKTSSLIAAETEQRILEQQNDTIVKLMQFYRGMGDKGISHDVLVGLVGELVALDTFRNKLEYEQRQAETASRKEYGDGKEPKAN